MEVALVVGGIIFLVWFVHGIQNNRLKDLEDELDDWDGVYDTKREVDNRLSDDDERDRVRKKYNSK